MSFKKSIPRVPSRTYGYVYLAKCLEADYYKIGFSNNPDKRIIAIETSSPFTIILIHAIRVSTGQKLEWELHDKFAHKRIKLEWFNLSEEDVQYIKLLPHEIGKFPDGVFEKSQSKIDKQNREERTKSLHKKIESQRSHIRRLETKIKRLQEKLATRNISTSEKELLEIMDQMRARIAYLEGELGIKND